MAGSVNKVILVGPLGAGPEVKAPPPGVPMAKLQIATNESWTDKTSGPRPGGAGGVALPAADLGVEHTEER